MLGVHRSVRSASVGVPSSELQALLSPYNSAACRRQSLQLTGFKVQNSELWLQIAPASAVCGELGLPSLERGTAE